MIALIDTGSRITCISENIYNKYFNHFKTCASFPLVGVQASGFTGEKSVRLKKQFRAQVTLGTCVGDCLSHLCICVHVVCIRRER